MAWKGHFWGRSLNSRHRARQPGCVWARLSLLKLAMATKHIVPASQGPGQQGRTTSKLFSALGSWPFSLVRKEHQYNKCDFSKDFIYFLERGEGRDKERERNTDVWEKHRSVTSHLPPTGNLARSPGMCPDWELNRRPFCVQGDAQPTEPQQPGQYNRF